MGCVYSDQNDDKTSAKNKNTNAPDDDSNHESLNGNNPRQRIFEACFIDSTRQQTKGQIEITNHDLIFHCGDRKEWPLKYIRGYGLSPDGIFSFECGRKCFTGPGIYVFRAAQADRLFDTLVQQIGSLALTTNAANAVSNQQTNNPQVGTLPNSVTPHSGTITGHEYLNSAAIEMQQDLSMPTRPGSTNDQARAPSSNGSLSGTGGMVNVPPPSNLFNKSQPNYYSSNPLTIHNGGGTRYFTGSKTSLTEPISNGQQAAAAVANHSSFQPMHRQSNSGFDSRTLPSKKNSPHSYVNASTAMSYTRDAENFRVRRSSDSNDHLYQNHRYDPVNNQKSINARRLEQVQSKMAESDDLGTFCYVNFDQDVIKQRKTAGKESYVQLDLNHSQKNKSSSNEPASSAVYVNHKLSLSNGETIATNENIDSVPQETNGRPVALTSVTAATKSHEKFSMLQDNGNHHQLHHHHHQQQQNGSNDNDSLEKNKATKSGSSASSNGGGIDNTSLPYAKIDFQKTMALSNMTANHRKLQDRRLTDTMT